MNNGSENEPRKVGIWVRVSTEQQVLDEAPEVHEFRARAYAESRGWDVHRVYRLDAVSGKTIINHPTTKEMLKAVENGEIDALVFSKTARLARNTKELLEIADIFNSFGADLVSLQENIDTSSPAGKMFFTLIGAVGEWERNETSARVKAALVSRAKMGLPSGGRPPYGYHWVDKTLVPNLDEAPIRKLAYELFLEHGHKLTVAKELNKRGFRTRSGNNWGYTSIHNILVDTTAKGIREVNKRIAVPKGNKRFKDQSEWITFPVEPIVDPKTWEEVNRLIETNRNKSPLHRRGRKPKNLFAGKLFCGRCGGSQKLYARTGMDKYCCYKCNLKIQKDAIEAIFVEELKSILLDEDKLAEYADTSEEKAREKAKLIRSLEAERSKAQARMDILLELYQERALDVEMFKQQCKPLETRILQIGKEIPKLDQERRILLADRNNQQAFKNEGIALADKWPSMTEPQKRRLVDLIFNKVTVLEDRVNYELTINPADYCKKSKKWSGRQDSNLRLLRPKRSALPS